MAPSAPGLVSMTTVWPSAWPSGCAKMRAPSSAAPPGGNGTISRIGLCGYCACAEPQRTASTSVTRSFFTSVPVRGIDGIELALERGEGVLAGALLSGSRLAHGLREHLGADRMDLARAARCDLHVASALQRPHHEERLRHARAQGKEPVIAQDHRRLVAQVAHQAFLLAGLDRDALEVVIRHAAVEHGAVE